MLAIDTNIIVRYLTGDDPQQSPQARNLINQEGVFVSTTVLLETEWVLRRAYGFSTDEIATALTAFAGLPQTTLEDPALAATAIEWMTNGLDFADALHLLKATGCEAFVSFDRRFAKKANRISDLQVRAP